MQILLVAAEHQALEPAAHGEVEIPLAVEDAHRRCEALDQRRHLGARAEQVGRAGHARLGEVPLHVVRHRPHLPPHGHARLAVESGRLVGQDGERRLERVGQAPHLAAGPLEQRRVVVEQGVGLAHQTGDLGREIGGQARSPPGAHVGQRRAQPAQRGQAEAQLQREHAGEPERQAAQGRRQSHAETAHIGRDVGLRPGHDHLVGLLVAGEADRAGEGTQRHTLRSDPSMNLLVAIRNLEREPDQRRGARLHLASALHLPVPARERALEAWVGRPPREHEAPLLDVARRGQLLDVIGERTVEAPLDGGAKQPQEQRAGRRQRDHQPGEPGDDQPRAERPRHQVSPSVAASR